MFLWSLILLRKACTKSMAKQKHTYIADTAIDVLPEYTTQCMHVHSNHTVTFQVLYTL